MFTLSWGDISMALLGAMTCLVCLSSPWALSQAEACVPHSHKTAQRMRWSALVPDVVLSAATTSHELLDSSHTRRQRPEWSALLSWDVTRLWDARRKPQCVGRGGAS